MNQGAVLYRGSLKSCNYHCGYCPFSKHQSSKRELERDQEAWFRFTESIAAGKVPGDFRALMVVPYGEALIHPWYWEGLAALSRLGQMDAVGAQTNLSFPLGESLERFGKAGGRVEKLRLWATFHPEMVSPERFAGKCRQVREAGIVLCVGAVGVPGNIGLIQRLKGLLPEDIYLWVNRMDGLKREYTKEEREAFLELDPYFWRELALPPADERQCRGRVFVESDGRMRLCNISRVTAENWYHPQAAVQGKAVGGQGGSWEEQSADRGTPLICGRKQCFCYLAYGGRADRMNTVMFGPYPVFRIPRRPKAVFLDIVGTLVPEDIGGGQARMLPGGSGLLPGGEMRQALEALVKEGALLFWATTLPEKEARRCCREAGQLFCGGVFAGGAHVHVECGGRENEYYYRLECGGLACLEALQRELGFRILSYRHGEMLYKLTFIRPERRPWTPQEAERMKNALEPGYQKKVRWILEGRCLQLVSAEATKAKGVEMICKWLGIALPEIAAAGDSGEDEEMMRLPDKAL